MFRERPAIHRFPGAMAERVQALCAELAERFGGDGSRVWTEATGGADLAKRVGSLPGIGDMKVRSHRRHADQAVRRPAARLGERASRTPDARRRRRAEELAEYQAAKRAHKQKVRAEKARKELA